MKVFVYLSFVGVLFLVACQSDEQEPQNIDRTTLNELLPNAQGNYSEVLIVVENKLWKNGLEATFKGVFAEEIKGLYTPEYNFDLVNVPPKAFSSLFKKYRVIVEVAINPSVSKAKIASKYNHLAKSQLYVKVTAPSVEELQKCIEDAKQALLTKVENYRLHNLRLKLGLNTKSSFTEALQEKFQAELLIPNSYQLVDDEQHLLYFGKQAKALCESGRNTECYYQMGFMMYQFPYNGSADSLGSYFSKTFLTQLRDSLTRVHIVGRDQADRAFMEIEQKFPVEISSTLINGYQAVEMKGWWNMVNATMGGPFKSYLLINEKQGKAYFLDGFVFGPNFSKRDFLMEIEAIVKSITFNSRS